MKSLKKIFPLFKIKLIKEKSDAVLLAKQNIRKNEHDLTLSLSLIAEDQAKK